MSFIEEESKRERELRQAVEKAAETDTDMPKSLKSKEVRKAESAKEKSERARKDYEQKQKTLEYKRERLEWQKERSKIKDQLRKEAEEKRKKREEQRGESKINIEPITDKDKDPTAYKKAIGGVASFGKAVLGAAAKSGVKAASSALKKRKERKDLEAKQNAVKDAFKKRMKAKLNQKLLPGSADRTALSSAKPPVGLLPSSGGQRARQDPAFKKREIEKRGGTVTEEFSCWREEFLYELGDMRRKKKKNRDDDERIVDVMTGTNNITIGPIIKEKYENIDEAVIKKSLLRKLGSKAADTALTASFLLPLVDPSGKGIVRSMAPPNEPHGPSSSMQLMSRMMQKRKEANRNLDSGRVSHPSRNKKKTDVKEALDKKTLLKAIVKKLIDEKKRKNYLLNYGYIGEASDKDNMKCNKPQRAPKGATQKYIVKACDNGEEKIVRFGFRGMQDFLQHKNEERRKNFKARHRCSEKKDKLTPGWWACNYNW